MKEIWKSVVGYEGLYEVSNLGRVKGIKRKTNRTFVKNHKGYYIVKLSKNNKVKTYGVHCLVAMAFIPNKLNKKQVNHINGIKTDNRVENLEWCSNSENLKHAFRIGLIDMEKHMIKVKKSALKRMKPFYQIKNGIIINEFNTVREAYRKTNINFGNINSALNGRHKSAGGYEWKYK